jgi:hypothetical protein
VKASDLVVPLVTVLLGGGGLAFLQAIFKGYGSLRGGARAHERESIADLARARDAADERANWAERDRDFWHAVAGRWRYQLVSNGIEPVLPDPIPPSERRGKTRPGKRGGYRGGGDAKDVPPPTRGDGAI